MNAPVVPRRRVLLAELLSAWSRLPPNTRGALFMICGAISATMMFTTVKLLGDRVDSVQIVFFRAVFCVAVAAPVLMRRGERGFRTGHLRLQVGTGVLGAIALIGFLLFSEIPDSWFWLGSAMIVAANIYIVRSRPKRKPDAAT